MLFFFFLVNKNCIVQSKVGFQGASSSEISSRISFPAFVSVVAIWGFYALVCQSGSDSSLQSPKLDFIFPIKAVFLSAVDEILK